MRRLFSRGRISVAVLPIALGCALAKQGDPPDPILDPGVGGDGNTAGSGNGGSGVGGTATGGVSGTSGTSGSTSGTSGATATGGASGSTATGGSAGSTPTGGSAGKGGSAGSTMGGSAGSTPTGGSAGKGGSAGSGTGGTTTGGAGGKGGSGGGAAGGPPGGMNLFSDNFEMGAGDWMPTPSGAWAIATDGSMVYAATGAASNSTWRAAVAGEASWTDVRIDARVKITSFPGSSTSYYAGICARYMSNSSYACFALRSDGKIAFRVNGSNTASATPPGGDIAEGIWYRVRVVARGANITAFINDVEIAAGTRVTSGAPTSGRLALATPGTNAVFDDIVVTTP